MTDLRTAAQQALETLEDIFGANKVDVGAINALRAALAEHFCDTHCTWADHAPGCVRAEPVQEPVAWRITDGEGDWEYCTYLPEDWSIQWSARYGRKYEPLYTAPPQRKPLTEEEIEQEYKKGYADGYAAGYDKAVEVARAIERAHGITE